MTKQDYDPKSYDTMEYLYFRTIFFTKEEWKQEWKETKHISMFIAKEEST